MTTGQLWTVAARLLAVYFIVDGALNLPNALFVSGMGMPEGSNRMAFVAVPLVRAAVLTLSGVLLLMFAGRTQTPAPATIDVQDGLAVALQLLGVFFVVGSLSAAAGPAVDMLYVDTSWHFRVGEFSGAAVGVAAGLLLAIRPRLVGLKLQAFRQSR
jgi:hypothetical protein